MEGAVDEEQDEKYKVSEEFMQDEKVRSIFTKEDNKDRNIFKDLVFFLSNEAPREQMEFMILAFGGKVYSHSENFESDVYSNETITHVVTDRDPKTFDIRADRDYVQPQWICDSINEKRRMPAGQYGPGKPLPPHLSPFVTDREEGYIPERRKELEEMKGNTMDLEDEESSSDSEGQEKEQDIVPEGGEIIDPSSEEEDDEDDEESSEETVEAKLAAAKAKGPLKKQAAAMAAEEDAEGDEDDEFEPYAEMEAFEVDTIEEQKKARAKKELKEKKDLSKLMLSKKKKRILSRIDFGKNKKKETVKKLKSRKAGAQKPKK